MDKSAHHSPEPRFINERQTGCWRDSPLTRAPNSSWKCFLGTEELSGVASGARLREYGAIPRSTNLLNVHHTEYGEHMLYISISIYYSRITKDMILHLSVLSHALTETNSPAKRNCTPHSVRGSGTTRDFICKCLVTRKNRKGWQLVSVSKPLYSRYYESFLLYI